MKRSLVALTVLALAPAGLLTAASPLDALEALYPDLEKLYVELHQSPELSHQEVRTAARLAERLRELGFEVTEKVGGTGVVGVLRNGKGPAVLLRADMDGLPVEEKTGLPYASRATGTDPDGKTVPVMHACGHDVHMTGAIGAATLLSKGRAAWAGTLVVMLQPAEERGAGAKAMLDDGLFTRFPRPDHAVAFHCWADGASGTVGFCPGYALANVDSVDVTIYGKGGHGAYPQATVDPIVIAARFVVALQTIVSRENDPRDPAVVTVGSIHGGFKHNIIPDEVKLQLTVRSYKEDVRKRLLSAIERIAKAEAAAADAPRAPAVTVGESTNATYNDPTLTRRLAGALSRRLGEAGVVETPPVMGAEDFGELARAGIPSAILWVGVVAPERHREAKASGVPLPSLHSPLFAPDRERTLKTAVTTLTVSALELLGRR